jgi:hypothetical protein
MTNINPSRHPDSWDVPARPFIIKPWLGEISSSGYVTIDATAMPTDTFERLPELARYSPVPAGIAKLELLPEPSSLCDEDWRTYLNDASFSNPMDPLQPHDEDGNTLEVDYRLDEGEALDESGHFLSEQLLFSAVPNFPTQSPAGFFDPLPFAENNTSPLSTGSPRSRAIPSPEHGFAVELQEDTPRHNETVCIPNGTYASLIELTPPAFDFGSARFSSLEAPSRPLAESVHVSSPNPSPQRCGRSPTIARRGLSGWGESQYLQIPEPTVIGVRRKRVRSPSNSPCSSLRRPHALSPLASTQGSEETSSTHDPKRSKASEDTSLSMRSVIGIEVVDPDSETDQEPVLEDDSDSDDYRPSRSSSVDLGVASSFSGILPEVVPVPPKQKSTRRGKGKAKGSAALALAVVTQLGAAKSRSGSEPSNDDGDDYDPVTLYREGRHGIRKKKNQTIPLPVPIPNLNKKSRGRKVPYVAGVKTSGSGSSKSAEASTEDQGSVLSFVADTETRMTTSSRSRRKTARGPTPVTSVNLAGDRTYVCAVPGCGKCFVRGEHLKRHVRSIHTHDKRKFRFPFLFAL